MKVTVELDVTGCNDCPFVYSHYGHGEAWDECNHPNHGRKTYQNILKYNREIGRETPDWCPFQLNQQPIDYDVPL